jgi:hypothetical protein
MFSQSSRTVRIIGLPREARKTSLDESAELLCEIHAQEGRFCRCFTLRRQAEEHPVVSLAPQGEHQTGTITFPSAELKNKFPESVARRKWTVDSDFNGLTVLHSAADPELE